MGVIERVLHELAAIRTALEAVAVGVGVTLQRQAPAPPLDTGEKVEGADGDVLLTPLEAAVELGIRNRKGEPRVRWIYENADRLGLAVRFGRKVMVSRRALDRIKRARWEP